jgi:FdrA protein
MKIVDLPADDLQVVNIGLESFAQDLRDQGVAVVQLDWRPPAGGNARMAALLASLEDDDEDNDETS